MIFNEGPVKKIVAERPPALGDCFPMKPKTSSRGISSLENFGNELPDDITTPDQKFFNNREKM